MKLNERLNNLRSRLAAVEGERDAAQAGEARAVEALRAVVTAASPHEEDTWTMEGSALRHVHRVLDQYEPTLDNQPSALDWLAQQRAEAVAAWIEKQVAENLERYGTHYYERTTDDLMREAAAFRAAALRAGGWTITNEQKAARLGEIADWHLSGENAALLREAAAMMRERGTVEWHTEGGAFKNGLYLWAGPVVNGFASLVQRGRRRLHLDWHPTLEAARSAAIAWVDQQEGK